MQTQLIDSLRDTAEGREADRILRSCVHCGFCTATCPTYQLLGDELDGPRGRIYQIKNMLEGEPVTRRAQQHLDRCLTCLNCETTCPSGVEYHKLVDIGRRYAEQRVSRPLGERLMRWGLRNIVPYPKRFVPLLKLGGVLRPLLPARLRAKLPAAGPDVGTAGRGAAGTGARSAPAMRAGALPAVSSAGGTSGEGRHTRRVLMLANCVEPALTPGAVGAAVRVLDALGIEVVQPPGGGCCGAVSQHLAAPEQAKAFMRRNIDAWWPQIEPEEGQGTEAILITASGCGAMVKDYGYLLRDDPAYAQRAARVSELARDLSQLLGPDDLARLPSPIDRGAPARIAFHPPCSLQHAQGLMGRVETLLRGTGFDLVPVRDSHSCCGSAGTYAILQPELSVRLRDDKLNALQQGAPALIATANVGCQTHLQAAARVPVVHWIELFDPERTFAAD
jgi:glycolate oxidase iron-sulfur subunit